MYHVSINTVLILLFQSSSKLELNRPQGAISFSHIRWASNMPLYVILGQRHFFTPISTHSINCTDIKGCPMILYYLMLQLKKKKKILIHRNKIGLHLLMILEKNQHI